MQASLRTKKHWDINIVKQMSVPKRRLISAYCLRRQPSNLLEGTLRMEFCKKSRIPSFSSLLCWTGENLWCNMSPVFSDNFLIASFSQETPCQKVEAHIVRVERGGTASQPTQVYDGTAFWTSFVGVEQILGNVFSFLIMFSVLGWSFNCFCGKMEVDRPRPIQSAAVFFQPRVLKTRTPCGKNAFRLVDCLGL